MAVASNLQKYLAVSRDLSHETRDSFLSENLDYSLHHMCAIAVQRKRHHVALDICQ